MSGVAAGNGGHRCGEENEMQGYGRDRLRLANELRAEQMREADIARRIQRPTRSIRSATGASIVRLGTRLAGEPTYELARSR